MSFLKQLVVLGMAFGLAGCASQRQVSLSEILQELEVRDVGSEDRAASAPDGPDAPSPPLPAALSSSTDMGSTDDPLTIQPACILRISVAEDSGLNGSYPVDDLGAISLGYVGPVILFDLTEKEAQRKIQDVLERRGKFNSATVTVQIGRQSYDQCRVVGLVNKPGLIKLGQGDYVTLNNALVRAGGLKGSASRLRAKIIRGGMKSPVWQSLPGEVYTFVDDKGNVRVPHITLRNNDVAVVYSWVAPSSNKHRISSSAGQWVLVLGEVNQEGFYQFNPKERFTMMNLYFKMGGLPQFANDKKVLVIRRGDDDVEERYTVDVRAILREGDPEKDFMLAPGDRIIVKEKRISLF